MIVFVNGEFVPEERAVVSVFDRGFLFGDALFEAILIHRGKPFRWDEHYLRLENGAEFLKFNTIPASKELREATAELLTRNQVSEGIMRLSISRGVTERGYSPKNARNPAVVISLHPAAKANWEELPQWNVITSSIRVPANDPLTAIKTANKIHHVLARAEADAAGAREAILLNSEGNLAEGTSCDIFWIKDDVVHTPTLACGALPGVTRALVLELCRRSNVLTREGKGTTEDLASADGVFLTMTSFGIVEVVSLDARALKTSPLTRRLHAEFIGILNLD